MKWLTAIVVILERLLALWDRWERYRHERARELDRERVQADPAGAFDEHFNGVRRASDVPDDAVTTDPSEPAELDSDAGRRDRAGPPRH